MADVTANYGTSLDFVAFFLAFSYIYNYMFDTVVPRMAESQMAEAFFAEKYMAEK